MKLNEVLATAFVLSVIALFLAGAATLTYWLIKEIKEDRR